MKHRPHTLASLCTAFFILLLGAISSLAQTPTNPPPNWPAPQEGDYTVHVPVEAESSWPTWALPEIAGDVRLAPRADKWISRVTPWRCAASATRRAAST